MDGIEMVVPVIVNVMFVPTDDTDEWPLRSAFARMSHCPAGYLSRAESNKITRTTAKLLKTLAISAEEERKASEMQALPRHAPDAHLFSIPNSPGEFKQEFFTGFPGRSAIGGNTAPSELQPP